MQKHEPNVYGVGHNDVNLITYYENGKKKSCPFYVKWRNMLRRCYDEVYKTESYKFVTVCNEWLTFSNFKAWMETQDWEEKDLDKDLLGDGSFYSPDTCCFLTKDQNRFLVESKSRRGDLPLGVSLRKNTSLYRAQIRNSLIKKPESLGNFKTPEQAHEAWRQRKLEIGLELFENSSEEVLTALYNKYK